MQIDLVRTLLARHRPVVNVACWVKSFGIGLYLILYHGKINYSSNIQKSIFFTIHIDICIGKLPVFIKTHKLYVGSDRFRKQFASRRTAENYKRHDTKSNKLDVK